MIKFLPLLLLIGYAVAMWYFSAWRLKSEMDVRSSPLRDQRLSAHLDRLARAMDLPEIRAHVYDVPMVNGLAVPDGRVFLTRGFIDKLDEGKVTPEELASVVAHELGHVASGHSKRRMVDFAGQNVIRMVLATVLGRFIPFIGVWVAGLLASALAARLSRQDEFEADAFASALLVKAGIGTDPQKSLFRKLERLTGSGGAMGAAPAWLRSHPATDQRIAAIESLERRWQL